MRPERPPEYSPGLDAKGGLPWVNGHADAPRPEGPRVARVQWASRGIGTVPRLSTYLA